MSQTTTPYRLAPEPYKLRREGRGRLLIKATFADGKEYAIAQVMHGPVSDHTAIAIAQIFEVAPELLKACRLAQAPLHALSKMADPDPGSGTMIALQAINEVLGKLGHITIERTVANNG